MGSRNKNHNFSGKTQKILEIRYKNLKKGLGRAENIAEKTLHSTKLHYAQGRDNILLYRALHELGMASLHQLKKSKGKSMEITPALRQLQARIKELEKQLGSTSKKLGKTKPKRSKAKLKHPKKTVKRHSSRAK